MQKFVALMKCLQEIDMFSCSATSDEGCTGILIYKLDSMK